MDGGPLNRTGRRQPSDTSLRFSQEAATLDNTNESPVTTHAEELSRDPLEAIYALNIGDFVADSFISDELLDKISHRLADDPAKLRAQIEELIHIYAMDKTLGVLGLDARQGFLIYDSVATTLAQMFQVDACHLFQIASKDTGEQNLSLTGTSIPLDATQRWEIAIPLQSMDVLSDTARSYETQVVLDVNQLPNWRPIERLGQAQTRSVMLTPLREGSKAMGVLVFESYAAAPDASRLGPELVHLADVTAKVFVTAMRLQQLVAEAQDQISQERLDTNALLNMRAHVTESIADLGIHQQNFAEALSLAVDARHNFTRGHSRQVAQLARAVAEALALNEKTVELVYLAGLVGSVGKVSLPQALMSKAEALTPAERDRLHDHPNVGVSLLMKINFLSEVAPYVQTQHERWDGSGFPDGLRGMSIPLGARILAVANAYYGMTQERPYRQGEPLTHEQALAALQQEAGALWDPLVVSTLAQISPDSFR